MNPKLPMDEHLYVLHGNDPWAMTHNLLEYLQPFKHLPAHAVIGIKPNLVTATPAGHGATTHPEIVEAVVAFLQAGGFSRIKIIESAWVGESTEKAFAVCGYRALAQKYNIPLKDLKQDEAVEKQARKQGFNLTEVTALAACGRIAPNAVRISLGCESYRDRVCRENNRVAKWVQTGRNNPVQIMRKP